MSQARTFFPSFLIKTNSLKLLTDLISHATQGQTYWQCSAQLSKLGIELVEK